MPIEWITGHKNIFRKEASLNQRFLLFIRVLYGPYIHVMYYMLHMIYMYQYYVLYTVHVYDIHVLHTHAMYMNKRV